MTESRRSKKPRTNDLSGCLTQLIEFSTSDRENIRHKRVSQHKLPRALPSRVRVKKRRDVKRVGWLKPQCISDPSIFSHFSRIAHTAKGEVDDDVLRAFDLQLGLGWKKEDNFLG